MFFIETLLYVIVSVLTYVSMVYIILPWSGVPKEPTGSWLVDHMFALMNAGSVAFLVMGFTMNWTLGAGIETMWMVVAGVIVIFSGYAVFHLRSRRG